jgi:hypothetical protein
LPVQAFLSLFLVLLAFFIVLAVVSQPEPARVVKAIASVRASFPSDLPLGSPTGEATNLFVETERQLPERIGRLVEADLPVGPPRRDAATGRIAVELPLEALFEGTALSRAGQAVLGRIAGFLASPPEATRLRVTGLVPDEGGASAARASRVARTLIDAGAPPAAVVVGVDRAGDRMVRLFFRLEQAEPPR